MKRFILQISIFSTFPLLIFLGIFYLADGYTDAYYLRFTAPSQHSLILGTSRSALGLNPTAMDSVLKGTHFFNYSFTLGHSPYGPVYFESIKRKLDKDTQDGLFILSVDPWSVSSLTADPNDVSDYREAGRFLDDLKMVSMKPNIFYLINDYEGSYFRILIDKVQEIAGTRPKPIYVHRNGWLEINIPMDSLSVSKRTLNKFEVYRKQNLPRYKISSLRIKYLQKTIAYLKEHGKVYLVRLPVPDDMIRIESMLYPDFEQDIKKLSMKLNVPYKSYRNNGSTYRYIDGNHLYKTSSRAVSVDIAHWIQAASAMAK